ncbi:MAG: hypothetical protein CL581_14210 [Alteromonadaceae bacterium]|nr:hypothetical protein [Alteromonadaceae bacterium]MBH84868.1 hypothetical protein [Alteromonadaceae bacterium]|tara:strand:- start:42998 stop:44092 length:1095 start_codon:yes stop_codon:yes gene_type:complete
MPEFQIRKDHFPTNRLIETPETEQIPAIVEGEVVVKIDRFSFTANNITYAAAGDQLGYWQFFPPSGENTTGWGVIPVWGFADVVESRAEGIPVGERLFGYFPPASYLKMLPVGVSEQRLIDGAPHRSTLPPGYNSYSRVAAEPGYDSSMDNERMLLWPLHITSFCLWDALQEKDWYGARQVVILSASSKTSIGLAYALDADPDAPPVIAVTSERNLDFVGKLGLYRQCVSYDDLAAIDADVPTVIVDMSGNGEVLGRLHSRLDDNMMFCINVGLTHWDEAAPGEGVNKQRSEFFFAPGHIQKRMKEWGPAGFASRSSTFMRETTLKCRSWLRLKDVEGLDGLAGVYPDVCEGRVAPDEGIIVKL